MAQHRVTLAEVARRAGVSRTTASYVLNGLGKDMRIAEDARSRVLRAAQELDYRPNLMARSLKTKVTHTLALVSDTIVTEQYAGRLVHGALAAAVRQGRLAYLVEGEGEPAAEQRLLEDLLDRQVDGFVYARMFTRPVRLPAGLAGQRRVLLNCYTEDGREPSVLPDELEAGRAAARAVVAAGLQDGAYLVGERAPHVFAGRQRLAGIEEVLAGAGARLAGEAPCAWWPESAREAVAGLLAEGVRPRALVCLNDRVALGAYQAVHAAGLAIPDDVSVVSFDDSELAAWLDPPLTSVALPHFAMGQRAVERLLAGDTEGTERVPMPLRVRASLAGGAARG
ncbi:LacI family DNA-binding transcriptional regulator [Motilibacter deserti]|uniref:LacI family DNA-binding transcriptional regulator n=1 Tax=Motilibacter deserti TaxID=2714956 RepID=A0ABX0GVF6_9ACTN|nr:LacI family DNA-binding transcriptional regulator [Motilibacter deserti]NHC13263.1 LacI family DNA-binding transcriptional regulator [Motilibacter deserti]